MIRSPDELRALGTTWIGSMGVDRPDALYVTDDSLYVLGRHEGELDFPGIATLPRPALRAGLFLARFAIE